MKYMSLCGTYDSDDKEPKSVPTNLTRKYVYAGGVALGCGYV
ncbi:MAG: hypothetical protein Q8Q12_11875 [bacterium]|nr:hypothetical protein [bacterium]